ncbi:hypothetical protein N7510_001792 [Penicillium lagena]|uniref:uncharacterized protein n=1 Tax=Penicillium lagena TaxID=94218 RepID=UPI00253F7E63|nr:uncharacterized protein N7510_001792 [Penicillium lagena]KAJ5625483.1 hypothetical protein N7510_001792 [Penicillium lagena]
MFMGTKVHFDHTPSAVIEGRFRDDVQYLLQKLAGFLSDHDGSAETTTGETEITTVLGAPRLIEFGKLFRRAPQPPRKSDYWIDHERLSELAASVWVKQAF